MYPLPRFLLAACLAFLCACSPPQPTALPTPPAATCTPESTATPHAKRTAPITLPTPSFTLTPSISPTPLPELRRTPPTLMLHRPNSKFDSLAFLKEFIAVVQEEKMRVVTYRDLSENPDLSATHSGALFIFTIDDIYLRYPIAPEVLQMIDLLKQAGYPAVLGVITESRITYPETVQTLKELSDLGWEIASHSDTHRNLLEVQEIAPKSVFPEVKTSLDKLEEALGLRPVTLVLPYGQMTNGAEQIKRTGVQWVAGINGGVTYSMDAAYYYVGREGAAGSPRELLEAMRQRFGA